MIERHENNYGDMSTTPDGDWVRWDDIKDLVEKNEAKPLEHVVDEEIAGYEFSGDVCPTCKFPPEDSDDLYCVNCGQKLIVPEVE